MIKSGTNQALMSGYPDIQILREFHITKNNMFEALGYTTDEEIYVELLVDFNKINDTLIKLADKKIIEYRSKILFDGIETEKIILNEFKKIYNDV